MNSRLPQSAGAPHGGARSRHCAMALHPAASQIEYLADIYKKPFLALPHENSSRLCASRNLNVVDKMRGIVRIVWNGFLADIIGGFVKRAAW